MKRLLPLLLLTACATAESEGRDETPLEPGQSRQIELRFTPLDVKNFEKALTRIDLRRLPPEVLKETWLTDLKLVGEPGGPPRMIDFALADLKGRDPTEPGRSIAEANLIRLLRMNPGDADLRGTVMEPLLALAPHLGFDPPEVLGAALGVGPGESFLTPRQLGGAMVDFVVGSHPNARVRPGPVDAEHPDGLYPVEPGTLPVFLEDVVSDLRTLRARFGPYAANGEYHPGFIAEPIEASLFGEDLAIIVRANVNGVPDKGVDLENVALAGVNSIDDHPDTLFDTSSPDWMAIEGTYEDPPRIGRMVFSMGESARYYQGGDARQPAPRGSSSVWQAPAYTLERVVAEAAFSRWSTLNHAPQWRRSDEADPLLQVTVEDGWMTLATPGGVGAPPPPSYIWDILLEVAQVRLHDGGLAEGDVALDLVLEDVPLGLSMTGLIDRVKESLAADPGPLVEVAVALFDNTWGEADFFYRRPRDEDADYLFFVAPADIPKAFDGSRVREYAYSTPGFFADAALTQPLHTTEAVDGDTTHLKVKVSEGLQFFCADENARVYRVDVGPKPSRARIALTVTRVE